MTCVIQFEASTNEYQGHRDGLFIVTSHSLPSGYHLSYQARSLESGPFCRSHIK